MTPEQCAFWLAGFMDGEGCVAYYPEVSSRSVVISNTSADLMAIVAECLTVLGIEYTLKNRGRQKRHWKDQLTIDVRGRANLDRFYTWVPFKHPEKVAKLRAALDSYQRNYPSHRASAKSVHTTDV